LNCTIYEKNREVVTLIFMNANKIFIGAIILLIIGFLIYISFALISLPFIVFLSLLS